MSWLVGASPSVGNSVSQLSSPDPVIERGGCRLVMMVPSHGHGTMTRLLRPPWLLSFSFSFLFFFSYSPGEDACVDGAHVAIFAGGPAI
jgi:hypothetical protein